MPNESKSTTSFLRVAEYLYRNESSGGYYALVKKSGKQIRRTLKTTDRTLAERRLRDFREQLIIVSQGNSAQARFSCLARVL